jgi:hypothetical protein
MKFLVILCNVCREYHTLNELIPINDSNETLGCSQIRTGDQALIMELTPKGLQDLREEQERIKNYIKKKEEGNYAK